jgi:N-acetyl-gamma-glutamyl-phosphate reductase
MSAVSVSHPRNGSAPATADPMAGESLPFVGPRLHARVAVLGASGYTGQEFARLCLAHPGLQLSLLVSREFAGRPGAEVLPGFDPRHASLPHVVAPDMLAELLAEDAFDTLVACLPHGEWRELATRQPALTEAAIRIVDLSSDHRDGADGYAYGLPEAFRGTLAGATRIANPGCYPTAATLALLPVAEAGALTERVTISALSGVSGAGRGPKLSTSFVELDGGAAFYQVGESHAHVAEIERNLSRLAGTHVSPAFAPQLAPMARGILLTASVELAQPLTPEDAHALYATRYAAEPFVRVLDAGEFPETRRVRGSNRCDVAVTTVHAGRTLIAMAAIDNLVKGAAGQAVQNLNVLLGWPEDWGLPLNGNPW